MVVLLFIQIVQNAKIKYVKGEKLKMERVTQDLCRSWKEEIKEIVDNKMNLVKKYEKRRKWVNASKRRRR